MSIIRIYTDHDTTNLLFTSDNSSKIQARLAEIGVRFEQWQTGSDLSAGAQAEEVISAYRKDIDRLMQEDGYQTVDVVSLSADHPQKDEFRRKFLSEHTHSEDEVRFFVRGQGLFYLHFGDQVYALMCEKNDLISVPDGTRHWFDMGPEPEFTCIRLFSNPEGWVASFTGEEIASTLPRYEALAGVA